MKILTKFIYFNVAFFMLVGCAGNSNEESTTDSSEKSSVLESTEELTTQTDGSTSKSELEESETDDENDITAEESVNNDSESTSSKSGDLNVDDKEDKEKLDQYSSEQIEYARIWSQLGPNQELDELYVRHIPDGTLLNPDDETSASYPEDVIQLAGSRLVDGSITYSSNGDGTINVYNVPLRWDGRYPASDKFYIDIIENTELVYIDPGSDEEIIELIKLLNVDY
ncbi:hypothetical protein [Oceanobacillus rekensis]|uniref:hypothetical protein n=1 Tax=Oceanobacillus rekensis TaxID=937927 RepID=UPI000B431BDA|nr:hypothetical protein [Oceanobacillus rekensis]